MLHLIRCTGMLFMVAFVFQAKAKAKVQSEPELLQAFVGACDANKASASRFVTDNIVYHHDVLSFFEVPLICYAAKAIGCGSRSKPALLKLEECSAIKEAWMNRTGTTFTVVWESKEQVNVDTAVLILAANDVNGTLITNQSSVDSIRTSFETRKGWYKGAEVDSLSLEEAETIAKRTIDVPLSVNIITQGEADLIYPILESYFKKELVKLRTLEELRKDEIGFQKFVIETFTQHIGEKRTSKMIKMYSNPRYARKMNRRKKGKCCSSGEGNSCR